MISWDPGCRNRLTNPKKKPASICNSLYPVSTGQLSAFFLPQAAAVPYSWTVIRCGFQLFVDIVLYPAKLFSQGMSDARGTTPNAEFCWCRQREGRSLYPVGRGETICFFIASGSSNSIQLEGCSVWFLAFLILLSVQRCFLQGGLDAGGTTPNAD